MSPPPPLLLHHHKNLPRRLLIIITFLLVVAASFPSLISSKCHEDDRGTLLKIKQHFGDAPYFDSWDPATDCCFSWENVGCLEDDDGNGGPVNSLYFPTDANLSGQIPFHLLTKFRSLDFLTFTGPKLTGELPPSISDFPVLTQLSITGTSISGPIPPSICKLMNTVLLLDLSSNRLTGTIPGCLRVQGSGSLDLGRNRLSGPIPASLVGTDTYAGINLDGNRLTGTIPRSLADSQLRWLNVSGNRLTGDASFLFKNESSTIEQLDISRNRLEFDLSDASFPLSLTALDLSRNLRIYGSIPQQISKLMNLKVFDVSYNRLCGPIPTVVGFMDPSSRPSFEHNKCLCGPPLEPCPPSFLLPHLTVTY